MLLSQHLITVQSKNPASSQIEPLCGKKDEAELAVLEAALAAPKLPVKPSPFASTSSSLGKVPWAGVSSQSTALVSDSKFTKQI
ncbi:hypothetical protein DKX38_015526 [Salix brachista]|uniref:Uncharacterized protein n=1 Tax=Salix brachista TaxID=2182728 RepID=A0A5N5L5G8_9ROSI|nr:hypothetical protein DKX38_015526 [Salix brachista]